LQHETYGDTCDYLCIKNSVSYTLVDMNNTHKPQRNKGNCKHCVLTGGSSGSATGYDLILPRST